MKTNKQVPAYLHQGTDIDRRTYVLNVAASTICHLIFFGVLFFFPDVSPRRPFMPSVINVSMVTLPDPGAAPKAVPAATQPSAKKKVAKPVTKPVVNLNRKRSETVSEAPRKWKPKKSLKKQTFKPPKPVEDTGTRVEEPDEGTDPDAVAKAIDEIRRKVGKTFPREGTGVSGVHGSSGPGMEMGPEEMYIRLVADDIEKNWAYSESMAGGQKGLIAIVSFTIMPNGDIRDIWFVERSGNRYFDESARKAVMKSNPARPHPPSIDKPSVTMMVRFIPK